MKINELVDKLTLFSNTIEGDFYIDEVTRILYSTDASLYRVKPSAVHRPKNKLEIKKLINFATENKLSIIARGAGTSLAGQVVGEGIVVDVSRYLNQIIELNVSESWIRVEPGVILDELNIYLKPYGLFFGPETSTSNRCTMGGMLGNNSCGSHSLIYGSTRDHILDATAYLSDGSEVVFKSLDKHEFEKKCIGDRLENKIYQNIHSILSNKDNQKRIVDEFPDPLNKRRNTGYAIDLLLDSAPFYNNETDFNFCKLIAGSEGTLAFVTEIKLNLVPLPPTEIGLLCVHFHTLEEALEANLIALQYKPTAIELMDNYILECTKENNEQLKNRFFVKGNPEAILIIEFVNDNLADLKNTASKLVGDLENLKYGYHYPLVLAEDTKKVWNLRKAGLGLLSNLPGNKRNVTVIEDTAVHPRFLPQYIAEFKLILKKYNQKCIYHAHIGSGELHLRPMLDLKDEADILIFEHLANDVALLVKKYKGSLSGEHGDGRLRSQFIPLMIGAENYELLKQIKKAWDPQNIFNPGKIVDAPKITSDFRYTIGESPVFKTYTDFSKSEGLLRAVENCNGSGDCRKSAIIGGTMCPSFMATKDEKDSTRGRANILREILTRNSMEAFNSSEIYNSLDLCLGCKACKTECPSNIDMAKLKVEFLQHYYDRNGISLRTYLIAHIAKINQIGSIFPKLTNFILSNKLTSKWIKRGLNFSEKRSFPLISRININKWLSDKDLTIKNEHKKGEVFLFIDEFTKYNDSNLLVTCIELLSKLGYKVNLLKHEISGRTFISKGMLKQAKQIAGKNVQIFFPVLNENIPLIGIEPSAILSFRDEYLDLLEGELKVKASQVAKYCFTFDEFIALEIDKGKIQKSQFNNKSKEILLHGHCQQKAIGSIVALIKVLSFPQNYSVSEIKTSCCGMAGSFGFEKEHYDLSMQIGELSLFPTLRLANQEVLVVASGTSCRHQIKDGTNRTALHPIEVLNNALI